MTDAGPATAKALFDSWEERHGHDRPDACPGCGDRVSTAALTNLVYSFEVCDCGEPEFDHLVETPWHRACFSTAPCFRFTPFRVRGRRGRPAYDTRECIRCGLTADRHPAS